MDKENTPIEETVSKNNNTASFLNQVNSILNISFDNKDIWGNNGKQGDRVILTELPPW